MNNIRQSQNHSQTKHSKHIKESNMKIIDIDINDLDNEFLDLIHSDSSQQHNIQMNEIAHTVVMNSLSLMEDFKKKMKTNREHLYLESILEISFPSEESSQLKDQVST